MREICNNRGKKKKKIKGSCYICLNPTHQSSSCRQRVHFIIVSSGTAITEVYAEELPEENEVLNTENSLISSGEMVLMQTAKADV